MVFGLAKVKIHMQKVLIFILFSIVSSNSFSQDVESKDDFIVITIYSKIKVAGMGCSECFDSLASRIKRTPYVNNVKKYYEQASITFSMPSDKYLSKKNIDKMVHKAGLLPLEIEVSKVEIEVEPDVDKVF